MKRAPITRKALIKRGAKIRPVNQKRRAKTHARNFDGGIDHDTWIRARRCVICDSQSRGQISPTQAAHAKARGMGGAGGDWRALVPLCNECHRLQETHGNQWIELMTGIDLVILATQLATEHEKENGTT